ncbi:hypothetical protein ABOZ94_001136 [Salmonella enterica]|nr:hypothetical protein [Salmonella enterica]EDI8900455.1 hypothetical protein [Salmonella enterica]EDN2516810.1 hypothetical protein [Salmonella enterica]EFW1497228.1 hypothetical protein [Salmonella enterica]EIF7516004.1 hypothetical protein [Salmonella enterica]
MINPNLTPKEKALVAARLLRENAFIPVDNSRTIRPDTKPGIIAADAIEQLVKENEELRARLVAFHRVLSPAIAVDPVAHPHTAHRHESFTVGARVRLKTSPDHRGMVITTQTDSHLIQSHYVQFKTPFEHGYWVDAQRLELIPDE